MRSAPAPRWGCGCSSPGGRAARSIWNRACGPALRLIGSNSYAFVHGYPLSMIPLFIGLGHVAYHAGITNRPLQRAAHPAAAPAGWAGDRLGHRLRGVLGDHRVQRRLRRGNGADRGSRDAAPWLSPAPGGGGGGGGGHAGVADPAQPAVRDLRDLHRAVGERAVPGRGGARASVACGLRGDDPGVVRAAPGGMRLRTAAGPRGRGGWRRWPGCGPRRCCSRSSWGASIWASSPRPRRRRPA
ncbi:MAG: hypothetical protein KatS3mg118_0009 [Paracoccaceae bacterium]|nr:MAG: hypothetical protein KatS3mg118_0009 [Paracoccaceae bacterium]